MLVRVRTKLRPVRRVSGVFPTRLIKNPSRLNPKRSLALILLSMKNAGVNPSLKQIERAGCPEDVHQPERQSRVPHENGRHAAIRKLVHDLRNPISGILSASQYLIEDAGPCLDQQQRAMLVSIEASGIRLLRLIEDFEPWGKRSGKPASSKEKPRRPYQSPVS